MGPGPGSARRGREARPACQGGASSHVLTEVPRPAPGRSRGRLAGPSGGTGRAGECARLCLPWSPVVEATRAALPPRARCTPRVREGVAARRLWGRLAAGRRPHGSRPVCQLWLAQPGGGTHASREQQRRRLAAASAPRGAKVTGPRSGGARCRRPAQLRRALRQRRWTAGRPGTLCPRWTPWPSGRRLRWPALPRR